MTSFVQSASNTGTSTVTVTLGANTTQGNCLVAFIALGGGGSLASVSSVTLGGASGNWGALKAVGDLTSGAEQLAIWADPACTGGQTAVAITVAGATATLAYVFEFSGIAASSILDQFGTADSGGSSTGPSFSVSTGGATTQASELAIACAYGFGTTITGPSSPWVNTSTLTNGSRDLQAGYNILSSTGTVTYAGTLGGATFNGQIVVTLKAQSARPPMLLGGSLSVFTVDSSAPGVINLGGTLSQIVYGGTDVVTANVLGGAMTVTANVLGGSISAGTVAGTIAMTNFGGSATGWTMQNINLNFAEFNDITLTGTITSSGSALNLTGYTVNMYLKPLAGVVDTDGRVIKLSSGGGSPAITITNAAAGAISVFVANADVQDQTHTFYRIDAVDGSSHINTAIFGNITYTAL